MLVDNITEDQNRKLQENPLEKDDCATLEDTWGQKKFRDTILNVEREILKENSLNLMKQDVASLKTQVMNLWKVFTG